MYSRVYVNLFLIYFPTPFSSSRDRHCGVVCRLLAGEDRGNLLTYYSQFCGNQTHR